MKWYIKDGVLSQEASTDAQVFSVSDDTTHIVIPDGVTTIAPSAFKSYYELESVHIPDSVVSIGDSAFSGSFSLTDLTIGKGVKHIGNQAFVGCDVLTELVLPDSVTDIGHSAFFYCSELQRISVGSNLTQVGQNAFAFCRSLIEVRFRGKWNAPFVNSLDKGLLGQVAFVTNDFENIPEELSLSAVFGFLHNISEFDTLDKINCFNYIMTHISPTDSELSAKEIPVYFTAFIQQIHQGNAEAADEIINHFRFILDLLEE